MEEEICKDIKQVKQVKSPKEHVCEECVKTGSHWVHLRTCQTCGVTLCCDSSPNKHYNNTSHPVAASAEPGERWLWCYEHEVMADY